MEHINNIIQAIYYTNYTNIAQNNDKRRRMIEHKSHQFASKDPCEVLYE